MKRSTVVRLALVILLVAVAVVLSVRYNVPQQLRSLLDWIQGQGAAGVLVFMVVYIMATVFFIPGSILTLGAGFVFGVLPGTAWVSVSSTIGALFAFLIGRYLARDWVKTRTQGNPRFSAIDDAVAREGWKIVLLTRLSPIFPFNMLNYAYGLTGVPAWRYFLASWIGMLPGTVMYVYFGSLAANLATLGRTEGGGRSPAEWALYGLGLAATVAVTIFVTRLARRALKSTVPIADGNGATQ